MGTFLDRIFSPPLPASERLVLALAEFHDGEAETLPLLRQLLAALRPDNDGIDAVRERYDNLINQLESDPALHAAFSKHLIHFIATRRLVTFFTDSGILPGTGFFSEWWRILGNRLLPEVPDERRLKDCLQIIFERPNDWRWLEQIPQEYAQRFWTAAVPKEQLNEVDQRAIQEQILDAILLLAHRVSGLGVDSELLRASPDFENNTPRFIALSAEALDFVNEFRKALDSQSKTLDDGSQLLVIADQCSTTLQQIRKRASVVGTSLHLSYVLTRSEQCLARLVDLIAILTPATPDTADEETISAWSKFTRSAFVAENRRNSLWHYMSQLSQLLAVRVTENAARSGEHYICESNADYRHMWRSAAGAGALIGAMALLKIFAAGLHAPLFIEAFLFSMIYGLGFVLIYLLGMTVATKQPAMTAQTLASLLGDLKPTRNADLQRLVDVVAAVFRSQLAAIAGNVMVALPVAIAIGFGLSQLAGAPIIETGKAAHLMADLDPLSWAIPHAAIAGFYLYLSGLITGYFENKAAYADIGRRIGLLRWLRRLLGGESAARLGNYIQDKLGGIMGNFLFGCMLGSTGVIGTLLGLPLDIRHIAFSSANIGYALTGFQFELPLMTVLWATLGIALIGFTNLTVSFALALRTALGARRIVFNHWGPLWRAIWRRFREHPRSFLLPPRQPVSPATKD